MIKLCVEQFRLHDKIKSMISKSKFPLANPHINQRIASGKRTSQRDSEERHHSSSLQTMRKFDRSK